HYHCCGYHPDLLAFPTRRSSDLPAPVERKFLSDRFEDADAVLGFSKKLKDFYPISVDHGAGGLTNLDFARISKHLRKLRPLATRSEEHTSELQSLAYLVCRLLLE